MLEIRIQSGVSYGGMIQKTTEDRYFYSLFVFTKSYVPQIYMNY